MGTLDLRYSHLIIGFSVALLAAACGGGGAPTTDSGSMMDACSQCTDVPGSNGDAQDTNGSGASTVSTTGEGFAFGNVMSAVWFQSLVTPGGVDVYLLDFPLTCAQFLPAHWIGTGPTSAHGLLLHFSSQAPGTYPTDFGAPDGGTPSNAFFYDGTISAYGSEGGSITLLTFSMTGSATGTFSFMSHQPTSGVATISGRFAATPCDGSPGQPPQ